MKKERVLPIVGSENIRELGGYQTIDGRKTKWRRLLRGAALAGLTEKDQLFLEKYGLKRIIDFRSAQESEEQPDQVIKGTQYLFLPVFEETEASPQGLVEELLGDQDGKTVMKKLYASFVTDPHSIATFGKFFEQLLLSDKEDQSLLFHCTAGKDRTGFAAALFLSALGVPKKVIMEDYLLTNQNLDKQKQQMQMLAESKHLSPALIANIDELFAADASYLDAAFSAIDENYGSVGNFLVEAIGFDSLAQEDLRELYLEKD